MIFSMRAARLLVSLAIGGLLMTGVSAELSMKTSLTRSSTVSEVSASLPECAVGTQNRSSICIKAYPF